MIGSRASSSSKEHPRIELQPARALGARLQVARRRGDVAVPQGRLHLGQGGIALDRVACVGSEARSSQHASDAREQIAYGHRLPLATPRCRNAPIVQFSSDLA